ncbi:MAG TPA: hypothetical protein VMU38_07255, partial [Candidatus Binatia bacterium]|nr:hypothetical protein [Candidatus Binatia bacterium]
VNQHNVGSHVGMIHGAVPVTPTRDSLGFGGKSIGAPVTLSKSFDSPRFAAANHALSARMPFDEQQKAVSRAIAGNTGRQNAPVTHGNANAPGARENAPVSRANGPTGSWQRFNQDRGNSIASHSLQAGGRAESGNLRAPSDSWGRFSQNRGSLSAPVSDRGSYARGERYSGDESRSSYPSYSRQSYPSYARDSYGTYGSYSRGSYPTYSRGSYPTYSRGSYPTYSRGSYPSYPHGELSAPHPYGGGGSGGVHGGGGGGGPRGGGGGRPPHS